MPERTNERSDKDYAIEHGGYLATAAENYLEAKNLYDMAVAGCADEVPNTDSLNDHHHALRAAIYEFRKRRDRALAALVPQTTKPEQEPDEVAEELDDYIHCAACGQPFNDGGGLYCSARCEEIGNPGAD